MTIENVCPAGSFYNTDTFVNTKPFFVPTMEEPELIYKIDLTIRETE
jgi:hypothetical protein